MTIVAMGRELGSRGKVVAEGVASALDAALIHYEIIDHLADRNRVRKSHVARFLENADLSKPLTAEDTLPTILAATEILDIASIPESVVLRGWGGVGLLRSVPHVVRVRITAPLEVRVRNLLEASGSTDDARVREEIALFDEAHSAVMKRHFGVDYSDPDLYDLVLDTAELDPSECAKCVVDFSLDKRFVETRTSRLTLVSLTTATHVRALLKLHPPTRDVSIDVVAAGDQVTLSGEVANEDIRTRCELVARRVPGIGSVSNQLRIAA
ncbi:MAG: cytidylate kinase family protein [Burkholderiales bacterium]